MATATSAVVSPAAPAGTPSNPAGRQQLKSSMGANSGNNNHNNNRRSTQSPIDGAQPRRNSSNKGWQSNAGQQKYNGSPAPTTSSSPTPGQAMKSRTTPSSAHGESDTHDKHMHDRTLFLLTRLLGKEVTVTVKSGAQYTGTFVGADPRSQDIGVSLKSVRLLKAPPGDTDEKGKDGEYITGGKERVMVFEPKDVVDIAAQKVMFENEVPHAPTHQNGASVGFKTDVDISAGTGPRAERELLKWQPDESAEVGLGLEDSSAGPGQGWNQFEANERLFGVKSDFDEHIYTTQVNREHPDYQIRAVEAARIAAEIEGAGSLNAHVAEERGLAAVDDSGMDEEDKYSGVQRTVPASNNPIRYTTPARRAPSAQSAVPLHDPAIIAAQLARPEASQAQQKSQSTQSTPASQAGQPTKSSEEGAAKSSGRPGLPEIITPMRGLPSGSPSLGKQGETPAIEQALNENFKNFVLVEKGRVKKKQADMAHRDRESKLRELKKFSENFTLKTAVPSDLVPILTKDKAKQAEILEKTKAAAAKAATGTQTAPSSAPGTQGSASGVQGASVVGKVPPPNSFAARDPERFRRETSALLENFPKYIPPAPAGLAQNVRRVQQDKNIPVRAPIPAAEQHRQHQQFPPTGPAASNQALSTASGQQQQQQQQQHTGAGKRLNVNARPFEFRPNPSAATFTPTFGGQSTNATPSPTSSANHANPNVNVTSRATSPSLFFGHKRLKTDKERPLIKNNFNPFEKMKKAKATSTTPSHVEPVGNANDYIDMPWGTAPIWPTTDANMDKSYKSMFAVKVDLEQNAVHTPQPPHMMPPQPHHPQMPHMPHINHPPHVPHQPHHGQMPQHLGIPPHYEQDAHLRQITSPPSVMPSPSLHTVPMAPYQQSPVPPQSQMAMYPGQQGAMGQYPGAPGGPQFSGYYNNGFRGAAGNPMMLHGPQPVPYAAGQMAGQFVQHPQMYGSPQQPQAYMNGPPPPTSQGFPSPGRPAPTMMMHQGSSQGTPGGAQMLPYGLQPGQGGPMYGAQGQQPPQSEFLPTGPAWLPPRSQSTVPFSSISSPRARYSHMSGQPSVPAAPGTPLLSPALAAFASPTLAPVPGFSSQPLQRSQTANKALDESRGVGRGRGGKGYHGGYSGNGGGRGGRGGNMNNAGPMPHVPGRPQDNVLVDTFSNDGSMNAVGMIRGHPPPPPHQAGPLPPPYYHGHQSHYPGNRGNYGGPSNGPPPPQQQQQQMAPPLQQQQQPPQQQQPVEAGEDGK